MQRIVNCPKCNRSASFSKHQSRQSCIYCGTQVIPQDFVVEIRTKTDRNSIIVGSALTSSEAEQIVHNYQENHPELEIISSSIYPRS